MPKQVVDEIIEWSISRPLWQRDAIRRIATGRGLTRADFDELTEICKASHGLAPAHPATPVEASHLPGSSGDVAAVTLAQVTHHRGVNALAPEQTVDFGPQLAIVFGYNAAGKSGFTRILKAACRSRGAEPIIGNVLVAETPAAPSATIIYKAGTGTHTYLWTANAEKPAALARVNVFDSQCAPVYLKDKTDVAFRPLGLDIFDRLADACGEVRARLEQEERRLGTAVSLPTVPEGSRAHQFLTSLTGLTKPDAVMAIATLTDDERIRLNELKAMKADAVANDPIKRAADLRQKSRRFSELAAVTKRIAMLLEPNALLELAALAQAGKDAKDSLDAVKREALSGLLAETGGDRWAAMWSAANEFAQISEPDQRFPETTADCPLCQQALMPDARVRLIKLAEFVKSRAQAAYDEAVENYRDALKPIESLVTDRSDIVLTLEELERDDAGLSVAVRGYLKNAKTIKAAVLSGDLGSPVAESPLARVRELSEALVARAIELENGAVEFRPDLKAELADLQSRELLAAHRDEIVREIDRRAKLSAYKSCLDETTTNQITRKSSELTKQAVTAELSAAFADEVKKLRFTHVLVELQAAGGARGALYHRISFSNAPTANVGDVLSEGEARALSLAAFLAELATSDARSAIIFDDPVSSLDHVWRDRIAQRLVAEASRRQVIVFTHDALFLRFLMDEAKRVGVDLHSQYVQRVSGHAGLASPILPWHAMNVNQRLGALRDRLQRAKKLHRDGDPAQYESAAREIFGLLRETWELGVPEVLLNDVVERYRHAIETKKASVLHDITTEDYKVLEEGMTAASRWIRGHDQAAADGTPIPEPHEIQRRIDELDEWAKAIRKRRQRK